jgi:Bacterial Ig-like domain (group 3)
MSTQRRESRGRRVARGRVFLLEPLEDRRLLANSFTAPDLSGLITQAYEGENTSRETIKVMLSALQTQLTNGPLADLNSGVVDGDGFVTESQSLVASYNQSVDQQLSHFPHINNMLKLQGQQVVANLISLNQQSTVGLTSSDNLPTVAGAAINTLTQGPIYSLDTPVSAYVTATQNFETDLGTVTDTLSSTSTTPLALSDVSTTIQAEAEGYRTAMDAGLQVTHPNLSSTVSAAVTTLENSVIAIANANSSTAQSDISTAIATFDSAILDTTGLFGLHGPVNQVNSELGYVPHNLTVKQAATSITSVSGTAAGTGPATLTATLNSATGTGLSGKVVSFTLDGAFAGTAVTDSSGIATLTGVPQSDTPGTDAGGIVASFGGDSTNLLSQNSGDLVVTQASTTTTLTSSTNPSASGASVTFTATVAATSTDSGTPTGTVNFLDNGTQIGTGTLSSGVATFSTTTLTIGTHPITAVYVGSTSFTTSTSSVLSQVVNQTSTTTLTSSPNPSVFGQAVTFTATVAASSGTGTPTGTVSFMEGTTTLGTGTLNSSGVATFSTTTLAVGTQSITAVYSGDTTFATSTSTAVSQVVNQSSTTTLTSSPNPSVFGQAVTFTATVAASSGTGTPTGTVSFMEGATTLGTGTLSSGVATFSTSTLAVGTQSITAVYGGDTTFATSTSTAVSQVVNQSGTTTALVSSLNPSTSGASVTFTATVAATTPGSGTPTGTVTFLDGATTLGTGTLSAGVATFSTASLAVGTHSITGSYGGDTDFTTSTSSAVSQVVS